ncbi:MAG TPA: 23S rRNA (guanosine(2251)-2'-O)-methyltransferase RlmB [Deltaproteobacteria bacterium]|nr:23S rRNA (guanosine(2251)-2'-O)-methyltransferase RlmB [Deltaproteobacteria bacterium]HQH99772.1 23S rRNA (guanosine(2251)-2'-O)-methyltransferase RlmB [Deltaproteobacteria bacterium]HQJ08671.1 23S rRNA (guanosine(2251)-2'-O)-methyltransferase RlmB [Deltaproteobacteria bacterium]
MEIIYGKNPVFEALSAGRRTVYEILVARQNYDEIAGAARKTPIQTLSKKELDAMAKTTFHQGIIAKVSPYPYAPLADILEKKVAVLLDSIEDPQNTGSIIRTAYALAEAGIIIPEDRAAHITPAVVKASAGAAEHASVVRVKNLRMSCKELKKAGFWIIGLEAEASMSITEVPSYDKIALLLGGEDIGVRSGLMKEADLMAHIPMKGSFNSLNVSQSAAIGLYELVVRRSASS